MAKYVQFDFGMDEPIYYEVENFGLENIKKLTSYKENWLRMSFLEGEARTFDGKLLDIYPSQLIKQVYYGKKLSYAKVKQMIGNDLRYKDLLWQMNKNCKDSFKSLKLSFTDDKDYEKQFTIYEKNFYKTNYCLFTLPNNFSTYKLNDNITMTIEEFDPSIKLDYNDILNNIEINSHIGEEYLNKNQHLLKLFKVFFEMLLKVCKNCSETTTKSIFSVYQFHFENIESLQTVDEIDFFLEIADYVYQFSRYNKELFNQYRNYVNEQYNEFIL